MAFIVTAQGGLIKITGHTYPIEEAASSLNATTGANDTVIIYDEDEKTPKTNAVYTDYTIDGVTGTTLGSAEAVADAIGTLIGTIVSGTISGTVDTNLIEVDGNAVNTSSGNADAGTQVVAIATDDVNLAAINVSTASIDTDTTTIAGDTTSLDTKIPAQGAALTASSTPVNIASDQTVPVSAASLPLPTGAATEATLSSVDSDTTTIAGDTTSIDGKLPTTLGQKAKAASLAVTLASDEDNINVDVASSVLPTGAATEATLSTIDTDTGNIATDTSTIAGAVSGSEMQVDVVASLPAGTNNIGDVDVATQPARDNATDTITASLDTSAIMDDTTSLTPKFAIINASTSGNNTLIAAVVGKKIRVLSYTFITGAAVNVRFEDGAAGTALTGIMEHGVNGGQSVSFSPVGHFETTANTLLNLELSGAVSVDGHITYVEV